MRPLSAGRSMRILSLATAALLALAMAGCGDAKSRAAKEVGKAREQLEKGNVKEARVYLLNAIKDDPSSSEGYALLGGVSLALGDIQEAEKSYRSALDLAPDSPEIRKAVAGYFLSTRRPRDAGEVLSPLLAPGRPTDAKANLLMAQVHLAAGSTAQALAVAVSAAEAASMDSEAWLGLFAVQEAVGRGDGARESLERAVRLAPNSEAVARTRVQYLVRRGRVSEAKDVLLQLGTEHPERVVYRVQYADLLFGTGDPSEAISIYREVLSAEDSAPLRIRLGSMLWEAGERAAAEEEWLQAASLAPAWPDPLIRLAQAKAERGALDEALADTQRALDLDQKSPEALALRGKIQLSRGEFALAAADLRSAMGEVDHPVKDWNLALARALLGTGDLTSARNILREIRQSGPMDGQSALLLARIEMTTGAVDAASAIAVAYSRDPALGREALILLGEGALRKNRPAEAERLFRRCLADHGGSLKAREGLALSLEAQKDHLAAEEQYRLAAEGSPQDLSAVRQLVGFYLRRERPADALAAAERAAAGGAVLSLQMLGDVQVATGHPEQAERTFREIVKAKPDYLPAYLKLVSVLVRQNRLTDADAELSAARRDKGEDPGLMAFHAMVKDAMGGREEANGIYRKILESHPDNVPALNNLAWNLNEGGKPQEALRYSSLAREKAPTDPFVADTHAWILYRSGDAITARDLLRWAVERAPENADIRKHLLVVENSLQKGSASK